MCLGGRGRGRSTAAQDGDVGGAVILAVARGGLAERDVKLPVQGVLDGPMGADGGHENLGHRHPRQRVGQQRVLVGLQLTGRDT